MAKAAVKTFDITTLSWGSWGDIDTIDLTRRDPVLNRSGHELGAIVTADARGRFVAVTREI